MKDNQEDLIIRKKEDNNVKYSANREDSRRDKVKKVTDQGKTIIGTDKIETTGKIKNIKETELQRTIMKVEETEEKTEADKTKGEKRGTITTEIEDEFLL